MQRTLLAAVFALACAPCIAQEFDVEALYQKWLNEENRTLEGHKVLDDPDIIQQLSALRLSDDAKVPEDQEGRFVHANLLLGICYLHGVGGAIEDAAQADEVAVELRAREIPCWIYLMVKRRATMDLQTDRLIQHLWSLDWYNDVELSEWAPLNFPAARFLAGTNILQHDFTDRDDEVYGDAAAMQYISDAARQGCLPAMVLAGREYVRGTIWTRDTTKALTLLEHAAEEEYAPALYELGRFFMPGGQRPDLVKCRAYMQRAARQGDQRAMRVLDRLPLKALEVYTLSEFYQQYVSAWGAPGERQFVGRIDGKTVLRSPPNPFLSRHQRAFEWLHDYVDEDAKAEDVTDENRRARVMYAECLLHGICGARQDAELGLHWLKQAQPLPSAKLLFAEWDVTAWVRLTAEAQLNLKEAIDAGFSPAIRLQSWIVLDGHEFEYAQGSKKLGWVLPEKNEAVADLVEQAKNGTVQAAAMLAEYYRERDAFAEWEKWGTRAAELGHAQSALLLGEEYFDVNTAHDDPEKARRMFELALYDAGTHAVASERLAWLDRLPLRDRCIELLGQFEESLLRYGEVDEFLAQHPHIAGVAQRASMDGHSAGHILYALCLLESHGIGEDDKLAQELLLKHSGEPIATYLQGRALEAGKGGRRPDFRGARWCYETVAAVDGAYASFRLGEMYRDGTGVDEDHEHAFEYFEDAAEGGCLPAMVAVAKAYRAGDGVEADANKAIEWIKKAAAEEYEPAETLLKKWQDE